LVKRDSVSKNLKSYFKKDISNAVFLGSIFFKEFVKTNQKMSQNNAKIYMEYYLIVEWTGCWWYWWHLELRVRRTEKGSKWAKNTIKWRSSKSLSGNAKMAWTWI